MSEIDIIQAIELAISHELEARRTYLDLSDQADDPELQRLLKEIAQEKAGHEASLRSRLRLYQQKHLLRDTISRYVSPNVCEEILKNPQLLKLGGKRQRVTVLFADIWGFTTISEKLEPEAVVEMLNHFFTAMVDIVFEHEGTLDKFIGDNLMAVFGTPLGNRAAGAQSRPLRPGHASAPAGDAERFVSHRPHRHRHQYRGSSGRQYRLASAHGFHRHRRRSQYRRQTGEPDPGVGRGYYCRTGDLPGNILIFPPGTMCTGGAEGAK